jgi:hypothetical protein
MPSWTQQGAWHKHPAREASISADADLNQKIVMALRRREPAIDFQSAHEGSFAGRPDPEMLAIAAGAGRVLVSHDRRTMIRHFAGFLRNQTSPGLIIVSQDADAALVIEDLLLVWAVTDAEDWMNRIELVPL